MVLNPGDAPEFLPLTVSASRRAAAAREVHLAAVAADTGASDAWLALLAGCQGPASRELPRRLRELAEVTTDYVGPGWWFSDGSAHRDRVTEAQLRIEDAVREGDGEEYAEAFADLDQAVATAVVSTPRPAGAAPLPSPRVHGEAGVANR